MLVKKGGCVLFQLTEMDYLLAYLEPFAIPIHLMTERRQDLPPKTCGGLIGVETWLRRERKVSEPNPKHLSLLEFRTNQREMDCVHFVNLDTVSVMTWILCDSTLLSVKQGKQPHR